MSLLQEAEEPLRSEIVSVRFTSDELQAIEALAERNVVTRAELVRSSVLNALEASKKPSPELVELAGLRLMLNNFLKPLAQGKVQSKEEIDRVVGVIRERKTSLAQEIMDGVKE